MRKRQELGGDDVLLKLKLLLLMLVYADWVRYVGGALKDELSLCHALTQQCPCRCEVISLRGRTDVS